MILRTHIYNVILVIQYNLTIILVNILLRLIIRYIYIYIYIL